MKFWTGTRDRRWNLIACAFVLVAGASCDSFLGFELGGVVAEQALQGDLAGGVSTCAPTSNRCGPPGLGFIVPDCPLGVVCFYPACNAHDICYGTCGNVRSVCDEEFYGDMLDICAAEALLEPPDAGRCLVLAYIYRETSIRFGQIPFDNAQAFACRCSGVESNVLVAPLKMKTIPAPQPPFEDADDDLLPDSWELDLGLDPRDPTDAWSDPDHDGLSNLAEFVLGSDPLTATATDGTDPSRAE